MKTEIVSAISDRGTWHRHLADDHGLEAHATGAAIDRAVTLLRDGEVVALPTETVYGLAADALNALAVAKIFEAKERPRFDPLIVHLPDRDWMERIADLETQDRQLISELADAFWPGPLTIVLPKREVVPDIVTAGLNTVAIRISAHPVFAEIIRAFGAPLAAPSANRFGRISPTAAAHVLEELNGRIPLIVDGGPAKHGLESTIIALRESEIEILRRGPITEEQLRGMGFQPMSHRQDADATDAARGIGFQPMDPFEDLSIRQGSYLPHWTQSGATYAVTFRLIDSLSKQVLADWEFERRDIVRTAQRQKRELSKAEREQLDRLYSEKIENYLDAGHGECWLRDERIARVVREALSHFEGERYEVSAWCIMPNHVHVIVRPKGGYTLPQILHTWKSFTAKEANRLLNRQGPFWQPESYDHLIRDEEDFRNQIRYALENPDKTGLKAPRGMGFQPMSHRQDADATRVSAPGQLPSHYAPKTPLRLIDDARSFSPDENLRTALLAWRTTKHDVRFVAIRHLSNTQNLTEAAANLFRFLRELDSAGLDLIVAEKLPEEGLGAAINDRLRRASRSIDVPLRD